MRVEDSAKVAARGDSQAAAELKGYFFLYTVLADRKKNTATASAVEALCSLKFATEEPTAARKLAMGYSSKQRALWVRPDRLSHAEIEGLESLDELFDERRTLIPNLRRFLLSAEFAAWEDRGSLNLKTFDDKYGDPPSPPGTTPRPTKMPAVTKSDLYRTMVRSSNRKDVAFRGAVLVGHDPRLRAERGVFWIGVRATHLQRARHRERQQAFWLRHDPDCMEEFPAAPPIRWFRGLGTPGLQHFAGDPESLRELFAALRRELAEEWGPQLIPTSQGRVPPTLSDAVFLPYVDTAANLEKELSPVVTALCQPRQGRSQKKRLVLFTNRTFPEVEKALVHAVGRDTMRHRCVIVTGTSTLSWIRRYPWAWVTKGRALNPREQESVMEELGTTLFAMGDRSRALRCTKAGLEHAGPNDWEYDPFLAQLEAFYPNHWDYLLEAGAYLSSPQQGSFNRLIDALAHSLSVLLVITREQNGQWRFDPPTDERVIKAVAVIEALANSGHAKTAAELAERLNEGVPHATALRKRIGRAIERVLNREQP